MIGEGPETFGEPILAVQWIRDCGEVYQPPFSSGTFVDSALLAGSPLAQVTFGVNAGQRTPRRGSRNISNNAWRLVARSRRFRRRHACAKLSRWLWGQTDGVKNPLSRVAFCGRALADYVTLKSDGESVWPSGVARCGSVWLCPVCSASIKVRRAQELEMAATRHIADGGSLSMVTFTVRHKLGMALKDVAEAEQSAFRALHNLKSFRALRSLVDHYVTSLEVTVGLNGWHPHIHQMLFVRAGVTTDELDFALGAVIDDWVRLVGSSLGLEPSLDRGVVMTHYGADVDAGVASYLSKIAGELTDGDMKSGRDAFALLDGVADGDVQDIARWIEFSEAMSGRRFMNYSKGFHDRFGTRDVSDAELVEMDDEVGSVVARVHRSQWHKMLNDGSLGEFLERVEVDLLGPAPPDE